MSETIEVGRERANVMAGRICAAAGLTARSECELLELIGEFDAADAIRWWVDVKSLAHWLSWCCSMTPGTAREHVRVARALRRMPTVTAAFRAGRLSYSKVREVTRVVDRLDEEQLCAIALTATASQLARMLSAFRSSAGGRLRLERERALGWQERESGAVDFRIRLPKEEAALLIAALTAAKDQFGAPPPAPCPDVPGTVASGASDGGTGPGAGDESADPLAARRDRAARRGRSRGPVDSTPVYGYADAVLDLARCFLVAAPEDRSGEDRTLVVVQVGAEHLTGSDAAGAADGHVPAGTPATTGGPGDLPAGSGSPTPASPPPDSSGNVPAGTSSAQPGPQPGGAGGRAAGEAPEVGCHIRGLGGIESETARRLACDSDLIGAVVDGTGEVLTLGRTRRLVSRAQRRALMIRDGGCQFPGCQQLRHLDAHHIVPWARGGPTDLDNLILLCRWHHTAVHEGGMRIVSVAAPSAGHRWDFVMPDGSPHQDWYDAEALAQLLAEQVARQQAAHAAIIEAVDDFGHPDAQRILPGWRGERFDLHECVQALFRMRLTDDKGEWKEAEDEEQREAA